MQLMGDALTVLGSRLGIAWDPANRGSYLIRHDENPGIRLDIKAGVTIEGNRTIVLPLCPEGETFEFLDQEMTSTTMKLTGIDPGSGLKVSLKTYIPFRPRDEKFSTVPAILMELSVERLSSNFRWKAQRTDLVKGELFIKIEGKQFLCSPLGREMDIFYKSRIREAGSSEGEYKITEKDCRDRLVLLGGVLEENTIKQNFSLDKGEKGEKIILAWCTYDEAVMEVLGEKCNFKYTEEFENLNDVVKWANNNFKNIIDNSEKVDTIFNSHTLGSSVSHLMAFSLHSWLMNTWWVKRPSGLDWFTVWEGTCYYQSTVDVEYTQSPFYLSVWPELLEMELNEWPLFSKKDERKGLFLSHDFGWFTRSSHQYYHHDMEVEENANYLLMAYAHWRRTGRDEVIVHYAEFIEKLLEYILACDTTGNGIPDQGCANTIDDASAAVQYGKEQIYLGIKAMAACIAGKEILEYCGRDGCERYGLFAEKARETIETYGFKEDHYVVTLTKTMEAQDPWTGRKEVKELQGWDAYHIYTANGLVLLNMVGCDTGLLQERLKKDITSSTSKTLGRYGSTHSSFVDYKSTEIFVPGLVASAPKVGWVSMNMLRDAAGAYLGVDLLSLADRYWDWQSTAASRQLTMFFETYYGNNLHYYPRGVAVFAYLEAALGFSYDAVSGERKCRPIRGSMTIPLLGFANWQEGTVPLVKTEIIDGCIKEII